MNTGKTTMKSSYFKFFAMIITSMVVMYFLTYLNSYDILGHAFFSETRLFMTLLMGSIMTLVMLAFMRKKYQNKVVNLLIVLGAMLLFGAALWLVRSQSTVNDVDYMEAMIPHHSIAILTSERANIEDYRVRELADSIIKAQRREIKVMDWLIKDIRQNGVADSEIEMQERPVPDFSGTEE